MRTLPIIDTDLFDLDDYTVCEAMNPDDLTAQELEQAALLEEFDELLDDYNSDTGDFYE